MKSVFGFRVRLGNPDLDFENLNPDFSIERTPRVLGLFGQWVVAPLTKKTEDSGYQIGGYEEYPQECLHEKTSIGASGTPGDFLIS